MAAAETARLIASLELQDKNFTRGLKAVERGVGRVDKKLGAFSGAINRTAIRAIDSLVARAADVPGAVISAAVEQESAITGIAKTVNGNIDAIVDDLKRLSTETGSTFTELAGIAELGGAMGIAKDDLAAFTEQVAILGATTNVSVEDAATALGQMGTVIGLTGDEMDNFAASLVDLGNKGNSTEAAILEIARRSGGAAKLFGIAKDETLGWAAAAANLGLNEELAGTALQNLFLKAMPQFIKGSKTLQTVTGKTGKQLKESFEKDASGAIQGLIKDLGKLSKGDQLKAIQKMFGKGSGLTRLILGLVQDQDNLTDSLETGTKAWEEGTAAQEEAAKRFGTSEFAFKRLNNAVNILAAGVGKELLPVLVELAEEGIEVLTRPSTQKAIKAFAQDLGKGIRGLADIITSVDWGSVAGFLGTAAGFAGQLVTWFTKMPGWAQAFLIGGFAATKLPVVGGLISELGKGLIKGVLGMNAGVVNINAAVVNGVGGAPGVVPGAKGGGPLGAVKAIITDFGAALSGLGLVGAAGLTIAAIAPVALFGLTNAIIDATGKPITQREFEGRVETAVRRGLNPANVPPAGTRVPAQGLQGDWLKDWTRRNSNLEPTMEEVALKTGADAATTKESARLMELARKAFVGRAGTTPLRTPPPVPGRRAGPSAADFKALQAKQQATKNAIENAKSISSRENSATKATVAEVAKKAQATENAIKNARSINSRENSAQKAEIARAKQAAATAGRNTSTAARNAGTTVSGTLTTVGSNIVAAVNGLDLSVNVTTVNRSSTVNNRYGPSGGSSTTGRTPSSYHP